MHIDILRVALDRTCGFMRGGRPTASSIVARIVTTRFFNLQFILLIIRMLLDIVLHINVDILWLQKFILHVGYEATTDSSGRV